MKEMYIMLFLSIFIGIIITLFIYLCVPLVLIAIGKQLRLKTLKIIIVCNCILGFILMSIITYILNDKSANMVPAVLWSSVAYWLMKKKLLSPLDAIPNKKIIDEEAQLNKDAKIGVILVLSIIGFCILTPILTIFF